MFPVVMGLEPDWAIFMSGIATVLFLLIVRSRVPSHLGRWWPTTWPASSRRPS